MREVALMLASVDDITPEDVVSYFSRPPNRYQRFIALVEKELNMLVDEDVLVVVKPRTYRPVDA